MSDQLVNPDRGEVSIPLDGKAYALLPTYAAISAVEQQLGSVVALAFRAATVLNQLTIREMSVVVCECMRAAAKDRGDSMLKDASAEKIAEQLAKGGVYQHTKTVEQLLNHMVFGGADPKKNEGAVSEPPRPPAS